MFRFLLVIGFLCVEIAIVRPNIEDNICDQSSKTSGRSDCVVTSKCAILDKLADQGEVVHCGVDLETGAAKICCPKSSQRFVRQVEASAAKDPYAIARQKCSEYSSARYVTTITAPTLPNRANITQRKMDCVVAFGLYGGYFARAKEFPHMAAIGYTRGPQKTVNDSRWLCDGTLISDRYVLTAAHCERSGDYEATWVRLGDVELHNDNDLAQPKDFRIMERILHPEYKTSSLYYDIMLLKLNDRVLFTPYMRPICLYSSPVVAPALRDKAIITGWSATGADERQSVALSRAKIKLANDDKCVESYKGNTKLAKGYDPGSMVCVGNELHGDDLCFSDSGGSLQVPIPDWTCMYSQVGITSYGARICGQKNVFSIYTKVSTYVPWIQSIVWP